MVTNILPISVVIYIAQHCAICEYTKEVAETIRRNFPQINLRIVDMNDPTEQIPDAVFATPTYLLNGQIWSLGNPSPEQVAVTFNELLSLHPQQ